MLLDLPPEVLDLIADHLEGDRASLRACCLVSKALKDAAQPVLWRNIRLDGSSKNVSAFARLAADGLGRHVRSLTAFKSNQQGIFPFFKVLAMLPLLREVAVPQDNSVVRPSGPDGFHETARYVSLACCRPFPTSWTSYRAELRHLQLSNLNVIISSPSSFTFRNLSTLSLLGLDSPRRVIEDLLRPSVVPSLRVLALGNLEGEEQSYLPALSTELLDQLDMLEVLVTELNLLPAGILDHPTPTLVRLNTSHLRDHLPILQAMRPLHLSIDSAIEPSLRLQRRSPNATRRALAGRFYNPLRTAVSTPSSRLSTLWLPTTLHPNHPSSGSVPLTLPPLLDECRQRGVDVRWVGEVKEEDGFHRAFWRYVREKKRERQEQQVA